MTLAVVSILYGACLALVQTDIKKIIAYSSISHLGYVMLGLREPRPHRHPGRGDADGEPRPRRGRPVPDGRHDLRALPHARARRVRRPREAAAGVLGVLRGPDARVDRAADDERIHRRVPGAARRVQRSLAAVRGRATTYPLVLAVERRGRRRARRALHAVVRAALPVRRGEGAAPAARRPRRCARRRSSAPIVVAVFALGLFPDEPMQKTELAARHTSNWWHVRRAIACALRPCGPRKRLPRAQPRSAP